jgi:Na+-transporting methylmalonyl-CoA/oxaloacetate decarboxylase gamma subunit
MRDLLWSALELTVLGMGMTFLSLGALALGMYVMTAIFRGKERAEVSVLGNELPAGDEVAAYREGEFAEERGADNEARRRAAAAAVAVALALTEARTAPGTQTASFAPPAIHDPWNAFARSLHLSRRTQYDARRFRG